MCLKPLLSKYPVAILFSAICIPTMQGQIAQAQEAPKTDKVKEVVKGELKPAVPPTRVESTIQWENSAFENADANTQWQSESLPRTLPVVDDPFNTPPTQGWSAEPAVDTFQPAKPIPPKPPTPPGNKLSVEISSPSNSNPKSNETTTPHLTKKVPVDNTKPNSTSQQKSSRAAQKQNSPVETGSAPGNDVPTISIPAQTYESTPTVPEGAQSRTQPIPTLSYSQSNGWQPEVNAPEPLPNGITLDQSQGLSHSPVSQSVLQPNQNFQSNPQPHQFPTPTFQSNDFNNGFQDNRLHNRARGRGRLAQPAQVMVQQPLMSQPLIQQPLVSAPGTPVIYGGPVVMQTQPRQRVGQNVYVPQTIIGQPVFQQPMFAQSQNQFDIQNKGPLRLGIRVDALYMSHSGADDTDFIFDDTTYAPIASHSDINPDFEAGTRFTGLYQNEDGTGYEFSFFEISDLMASLTASNVVPVSYGAIPASPVQTYTASYQSSIQSYEVNAFNSRTPALRFGVGLRSFDLNEEFDIVEGAVAGEGSGFFSQTDNTLFGAQITADLRKHISSRATIEGGVRFGLFHNEIDVAYQSQNRDFAYEDTAFSTGLEIRAGIAIRSSQFLTHRIGYQALHLGNIALAPNQSTGYNFFATSQSAALETLSFHGIYAGTTLMF